MATTKTITVRLDESDYLHIQKNMKDFGCRSVSEFARQACDEKLERRSIATFVEQEISRLDKRQQRFESTAVELMKMQVSANDKNQKVIERIGENLTKIAANMR